MGLACFSPFEKVSSQPYVSPPVSGDTKEIPETPALLCGGPTSSMVTTSSVPVQQASPVPEFNWIKFSVHPLWQLDS